MPLFVVDASVAVKWLVREADTRAAMRLLDDQDNSFLAPSLFPAEVVNALLRQHRKGQLGDAVLDGILAELDLLMPDLVPIGSLMTLAVSISRRVHHSLYDCLYLALAEQRGLLLVTADEEFVTRCRTRLAGNPLTRRLVTLSTFGQP